MRRMRACWAAGLQQNCVWCSTVAADPFIGLRQNRPSVEPSGLCSPVVASYALQGPLWAGSVTMELTLETLQAEVLKLPAADRVRLLDVLLDSIDEDDEVEREWERVADERDAELESGTASPVDGPSVLARLRTKYGA